MNLKGILSWESERKTDITMLIASVASSKYQEIEEFLSPFNTVAPSRHIQNHFVLLFHAHKCKAQALLVTNLRLWNIYNIITLLLHCYTHTSLPLWATVEGRYWCGLEFFFPQQLWAGSPVSLMDNLVLHSRYFPSVNPVCLPIRSFLYKLLQYGWKEQKWEWTQVLWSHTLG